MAVIDKNKLKEWFKNLSKPTQEQFWAWLDSFWHKDEKIPKENIKGLDELFSNVASTEDLKNYVLTDGANIDENSREKLREKLGVGDLPENIATTDYVDENSKNVANNKLTSKAGAGLNLGALWEIDSQGYPMRIKSLGDKSNDTTFNRMLVQNDDGNLAWTNGSEQIINAMKEASVEQKDRFRIASRKSNENYSLGQPQINAVILPFVDNSKTFYQYVSLIGLNLFVDNQTPNASLIMKRIKNVNGELLSTPEEYPIDNYSVMQNTPTILNFGLKWNNYPEGYYQFYCTHNGLINPTSPELYVKNGIEFLNINSENMKWYNQEDGSMVDNVDVEGSLNYTNINYNNNITNIYSKEILSPEQIQNSNGFIIKCSVDSSRKGQGASFYKGSKVNISGADGFNEGVDIMDNYGNEIIYFAYYNGFLTIVEEKKGKTKVITSPSMTSMGRFIRFIDNGGGKGNIKIKITQYLILN